MFVVFVTQHVPAKLCALSPDDTIKSQSNESVRPITSRWKSEHKPLELTSVLHAGQRSSALRTADWLQTGR